MASFTRQFSIYFFVAWQWKQSIWLPEIQNWHWTQHFSQAHEDKVLFLPNLLLIQMLPQGLHHSCWMKQSLDHSPNPGQKNVIYQLRGFLGALGMSLAFILHIEEEAMLLSVFHLHFSLSLSWFQPIFVSFVAISTALCPCFKAMLLGQNLP